jgi:hypothetical protein
MGAVFLDKVTSLDRYLLLIRPGPAEIAGRDPEREINGDLEHEVHGAPGLRDAFGGRNGKLYARYEPPDPREWVHSALIVPVLELMRCVRMADGLRLRPFAR